MPFISNLTVFMASMMIMNKKNKQTNSAVISSSLPAAGGAVVTSTGVCLCSVMLTVDWNLKGKYTLLCEHNEEKGLKEEQERETLCDSVVNLNT